MSAKFPSNGHSSDNGGQGFVVGLLCGAAVGAALGLLFAPKSGEDLRDQIADSADKVRRRANDSYGRATSAVSDLADRGRDAIRRGRETLEDAQAAFSKEMADARSNIE